MASIAFEPPGSPSNSFLRSSGAEYQQFCKQIQTHLDNDEFKALDTFFHQSHVRFDSVLVRQKPLDCMLETYLEKPKNDDDCIRAFRLAVMMENFTYSPRFAKIAQASCYFQLGNETDGNKLVDEMITFDRQNPGSELYISELNQYQQVYESTGNGAMKERIQELRDKYNAKTIGCAPLPNGKLPLGAIRI